MLKKYTGKLYCFSPPVMLATFLLEIAMVLYVVWRYKLNTIGKLVTSLLLSLGIFQLAEYMVCGGLGLGSTEWARVGYASITLLPALGIHLSMTIAGKQSKRLLYAAYGSAALFSIYFMLVPGALNEHECRANYAVFNIADIGSELYMLQYYGWLFIGIGNALKWAREVPKKAKALYAMVAGYLVFVVPTTTVNLIDPSTIAGVPSIMCGFAILFALLLVFFILPQVGTTKKSGKETP